MRVFVYEDIDGFDWKRFLPLMPDERQRRTLRYHLNTDRRLCVASYVLLCKALSITHGIYGQLRFFSGNMASRIFLIIPIFSILFIATAMLCVLYRIAK